MKVVKKGENKSTRGQATTEYVMLLFVIVSIVTVVGIGFTNKMRSLLQGRLAQSLQKQFFSPDGVHRFPLSIPK